MSALLEIGLSNALAATALALLAAVVSRWAARPALVHALWLLVLIKLVTPPLVTVPIVQPEEAAAGTASGSPAIVDSIVYVASPIETPLPPGLPESAEQEAEPAFGEAMPFAQVVPESGTAEQGEPQLPRTAGEPPDPKIGFLANLATCLRSYAVPGLLLIWTAGSLSWLVLTLYRVRRFRRMLSFVRPMPPALLREVRQLSAKMELPRCPEAWLLPGAVSPMLWALGRVPKLLFPANLLERLNANQQRSLVAHELAHLKRRDHWVRALELVATGLFWWHPVLWWARRELREAEELCCDAWVIWALPGSARAYALALLETLDYLAGAPRSAKWASSLPVAASGAGPFPILKRRFTMIMQGRTPRALGLAGVLGVVGLGAALLPLSPVFAQDVAQEREREQERERDVERRREAERREVEKREVERRDADRREPERREERRVIERKEAERRDPERREGERREGDVRRAEVEFRRAIELKEREAQERAHAARDQEANVRAEMQKMARRLEEERARAMEELESARRRIDALERELRSLRGRGDAEPRRDEPRPDPRPAGRSGDRPGERDRDRRPDGPQQQPGQPPQPMRPGAVAAPPGAGFRPMEGGKPGMGGGFAGGTGGFAGNMGMGGFGTPAGRDTERRLGELEKKMETLLQELGELRKEMRRGGPPRSAAPAGFSPPGVVSTPEVPVAPGYGAPAVVPAPPTSASPRSTPAPVVAPVPATPTAPRTAPPARRPAEPRAEKADDTAIRINVTKKDDGEHEIAINGKRLEGDLAKAIEELPGKADERTILLTATGDVDFKVVRELTEAAGKQGGKVHVQVGETRP